MLFFEIQEGRVCVSKKEYFDTLGATASCVMCAVDAGTNFSPFNDLNFFIEYAHYDKPGLKNPPSNNKCLSSKACSETQKSDDMENSDDESATGLIPLSETEEE